MRRAALRFALVAALATLGAGCETFAETVGCGMGLVLDEDDRCVPPTRPDGGEGVTSCVALCAQVPTWSAERRACLETQLATFGALPEVCVGIESTEQCLECVATAGATDAACAGVPGLCP